MTKSAACSFLLACLVSMPWSAHASSVIESDPGTDLTIKTGSNVVLTVCSGEAASKCPEGFKDIIVIGTDPSKPAGWINPYSGANSFTPTGSILWYAGTSCPYGYMEANGMVVPTVGFPVLAGVVGGTYGEYGTLPDLRGKFVRGWDHNANVDAGRVLGSSQQDAFQGHWHNVASGAHGTGGMAFVGGSSSYTENPLPALTTVHGALSDGPDGEPRTANETRPKNIALIACIKT